MTPRRDLSTGETIKPYDPFVEKLTHTAYFVQTKRIKPSLNSRLEKLLSIFEQANFISGSETTKDYALDADDPEIEAVLDILRYAAADAETRKELDEEAYYQRYVYQTFGEQCERMEKQAKEIAETKREIEEVRQENEEIRQREEEAMRQKEEANRKTEEAKRQLLQTARYLKYDVKISAPEIAKLTSLAEADVEKL
jgi:hypothetical protein